MEHSDCALTCIRMIARFFGKKISIQYLKSITDYSRLGMSINDIINCSSTIGLFDFVMSLPMKLNTKLGVAGIELGGGQKQRLMIARALYKEPRFLFLDEATSSLDANTEKLIVDNISKYKANKTIIIAAHRLSTIQNADYILFLKDGRIAEEGTPSELYNNRGHYWKLVKNQLKVKEDVPVEQIDPVSKKC